MGLLDVYKFVEKAAMSYMGGEIERMTRDFKRDIQYKSDDEIREIAHKIQNGEYGNAPVAPIVREEMRRRGMIGGN